MLNLVANRYLEESALVSLREGFQQVGYVRLPGLLDARALSAVAARVHGLRQNATRRSFIMPGPGTPRQMSTLGGRRIAEEDPLLASVYWHGQVLALVRALTGKMICPCEHEQEFMVVNYLLHDGDSHGWHLDDPAYALVLVLDGPGPEGGGLLEFIPKWTSRCAAWGVRPGENVSSAVAAARLQGLVEVRHHAPGDGYLLEASTALHRVTALKGATTKRVALNMAYQDVLHQAYGHTATALYGDDEASKTSAPNDRCPAGEQTI